VPSPGAPAAAGLQGIADRTGAVLGGGHDLCSDTGSFSPKLAFSLQPVLIRGTGGATPLHPAFMSAAANELRVDADGDRVVHAEYFLFQVPPWRALSAVIYLSSTGK
jgi:hypothetical protein